MIDEDSIIQDKRFCFCGCGQEVRKRFVSGHNKKGSLNPNWRGGRRITSAGYVIIWKPDHPRANKDIGAVYEHILVYEEYYKCCVLTTGHIHHINGIKDDNRIENLELISKAEHHRHHAIIQYLSGEIIFGNSKRYSRQFQSVTNASES